MAEYVAKVKMSSTAAIFITIKEGWFVKFQILDEYT